MKKPILAAVLSVACSLAALAQSLTADQNFIDFGTVVYGNKDSVEVTLSNTTGQDVTIEEFRFFSMFNSQPFYTNTSGLMVPAGGENSFYIVFEPVHNITHNSELVIYDNGSRGSIAIDLHGTGQYSMPYYAGTFNLSDVELKVALKDITGAGYQSHSYDAARDEMFMVVDNKKVNGEGASVNTLTRAYLGTDAVGYTSRSNAQSSFNLNTEHTWPQGFFNQDLPMRSDLHHLFVTDVNANSTRENLQFGNVVSNVIWSQNGSKKGSDQFGTTVFEPRDGHKGKTARAVLYFIIRYQNYGSYLALNQENALKTWNDQFPPTSQEVVRNDLIQDFQNNRNPFSDFPQFVDRIYRFGHDINRPQIAEVELSQTTLNFGAVEDNATYNLVLTNKGNAAAQVAEFGISGGSGAFALPDGFPSSTSLEPGESMDIPVSAEAVAQAETGILSFTITSASGVQHEEIPMEIFEPTGIFVNYLTDFSVFPVPAFEVISVSAPASGLDAATGYQIATISGKVVATGDFHCAASPCVVDVQDLPQGIYLLSVLKQGIPLATEKIVIQRQTR